MNHAPHAGRCLCGGVHYRVEGDFDRVTHCHCSMCRKTHGAAFATYATVSISQVSIETDDGKLAWYSSSITAERGFCTGCGASLFWRDETREPGLVAFSLGTVDTPLGGIEIRDIFVESGADWHQIRPSSSPKQSTTLHEQWAITLRHAAAARFHLPERLEGQHLETLDADASCYLHHNEFELAVEALEGIGNASSPLRQFWIELGLACSSMGLHERAESMNQKAKEAGG